jgi:hypothetical protein
VQKVPWGSVLVSRLKCNWKIKARSLPEKQALRILDVAFAIEKQMPATTADLAPKDSGANTRQQ